jgi:hypothetical protein
MDPERSKIIVITSFPRVAWALSLTERVPYCGRRAIKKVLIEAVALIVTRVCPLSSVTKPTVTEGEIASREVER